MSDIYKKLYEIVLKRKTEPVEGSYSCYLFEKGLDKILKKVGEESAEVIIAAKNGNNSDLTEEICDLYYHLFVLMAERGLQLSEVEETLKKRAEKIGNFKKQKNTDQLT